MKINMVKQHRKQLFTLAEWDQAPGLVDQEQTRTDFSPQDLETLR